MRPRLIKTSIWILSRRRVFYTKIMPLLLRRTNHQRTMKEENYLKKEENKNGMKMLFIG